MRISRYISMLALISAVLAGCKSREPVHAVGAQSERARIVESKEVLVPASLRVTGTLHARETATLSAQVMGRVEQVLVREGDSVRPGQALVILDGATLQSASEQAEAAVKAAEGQQSAAQTNADLAASTLARYRQLQAQKSVSLQEIDEVARRAEAASAQAEAARAQANAMKAQQAGARAMLAYTRVLAPFSGVVTARMVDPGTLASPGVPLLQIDSAGPLQLQSTVAQSALGFVRTGMKVGITIDSIQGADPQGTVAQIVPAADASTHSFLLKIDVPAGKELRAGMYATAEIPTGQKQAIVVPRSAIVVRGSLACAYILDDQNIAQLRYVISGAVHGDAVEILSGISAREKLVDDPADRDLAGKRIEVQP